MKHLRFAAYHGTNARLRPGDLISAGHEPNFGWSSPEHVYFTDETRYGDAVKFALRAARRRGGQPHVYQVEPTGDFEPDPEFAFTKNIFRTRDPVRVLAEDTYWKGDSRWPTPA